MRLFATIDSWDKGRWKTVELIPEDGAFNTFSSPLGICFLSGVTSLFRTQEMHVTIVFYSSRTPLVQILQEWLHFLSCDFEKWKDDNCFTKRDSHFLTERNKRTAVALGIEMYSQWLQHFVHRKTSTFRWRRRTSPASSSTLQEFPSFSYSRSDCIRSVTSSDNLFENWEEGESFTKLNIHFLAQRNKCAAVTLGIEM